MSDPTSIMTAMNNEQVAVQVPGENQWQRYARAAQSQWRERQGLGAGPWPGKADTLLGSRLTVADGAAGLNFLSPRAWAAAQESIGSAKGEGAMVQEDRMLTNLLSSQPLCFNLFADLATDLPLATNVLRQLWPSIDAVTSIKFEYNPHRANPAYTGTRTAFDVFAEYTHTDGGRGFLGIEVKYHEDLAGKGFDLATTTAPERLRVLSDERLGITVDAGSVMTRSPLWQIWLDHLLAESYLDRGDYEHGEFVFLYPSQNTACAKAWTEYASLASGKRHKLHLETLISAIALGGNEVLAEQLGDRYLP